MLCLANITQASDQHQILSFDQDSYFLQYSIRAPLTGGYINEYLREGEELKRYTKMLAVHHYPRMNMSPSQAAKRLGTLVKQSNPQANYSTMENKESNEAIVDFFTWSETSENIIAEFNIFRYKKHPQGQGLIAYQFVFRNYGDNFQKYAEEFKENRQKWIKLVITSPFPSIIEENFHASNNLDVQ